jgi:ketosteroid isomerase-like protein
MGLSDRLNKQNGNGAGSSVAERPAGIALVSFLPDQEPLMGRARIEELFAQLKPDTPSTLQITSARSHISGSLAYEAGTFTLTGTEPGPLLEQETRGKYLAIFMRQGNGVWRIKTHMISTAQHQEQK